MRASDVTMQAGIDGMLKDVENDMFYLEGLLLEPERLRLTEAERLGLEAADSAIDEAIAYAGQTLSLSPYTCRVASLIAKMPKEDGITMELHTEQVVDQLYATIARYHDLLSPRSFELMANATAPGMTTAIYRPNAVLMHLAFIGDTIANSMAKGKSKAETAALLHVRYRHDPLFSAALEGYSSHAQDIVLN